MINRRAGALSLGAVYFIESSHECRLRGTRTKPSGAGGRRKSHLNSKSISQPLPHDVVAGRRGYRSSVAYRSRAVRWPPRPSWPRRSPFPSRRRSDAVHPLGRPDRVATAARPGAVVATTAAASNIKYDICTARNRRLHRLQQLLLPDCVRLHAGIE